MPSLFLHYANDGPCSFHRQLLPARFCAPDFSPLGCEIEVGTFVPDGTSWYGLHGLPRPEAALEIARHKFRGGKFLWGLDDDFLSIPDWNPAKPRDDHAMSIWQITRDLADLIVVSTQALADTLSDVSEKVMIAPNLLDLRIYPEWDAEQTEYQITLPVKVGWSGGPTHKGDTELIDDALCELLTRFGPRELQVAWFGPMPPPKVTRQFLHKPGMPLAYQPGEKLALYQPTLNHMRPDVWMAPLAEIAFNESKSNLRIIEAWGLQAVPVASRWGEYNCIRSGIDGRYANSTDEWASAISRLVVDHEFRLTLARAGRTRVEQEYNWDKYSCRMPWTKVFSRVFGCPIPENRESCLVV